MAATSPPSDSLDSREQHDNEQHDTGEEHTVSTIVLPEQSTSVEDDTQGSSWSGWAELENDPLIFTAILHSWGVRNVQVNEVIPLDTILEINSSQVLGLIFLSRWVEPEEDNEAETIPADLWFANQISTYSCATLALMNIINNQTDIELGSELQQLKEETLSMSPKERGLKLDNFQFVKDIHNSFSRQLDRLNVDLRLKEEVQAAARKSRKSRKNWAKRKKKRYVEDDEESGFHFVAYVPAHGRIWKMDGTEQYPRQIGSYDSRDDWLIQTISDLQTMLAAAEGDGTEFSLLSLNLEPNHIPSADDQARTERMKEDWSPFIYHMLKLHAEKGDLQELLQ